MIDLKNICNKYIFIKGPYCGFSEHLSILFLIFDHFHICYLCWREDKLFPSVILDGDCIALETTTPSVIFVEILWTFASGKLTCSKWNCTLQCKGISYVSCQHCFVFYVWIKVGRWSLAAVNPTQSGLGMWVVEKSGAEEKCWPKTVLDRLGMINRRKWTNWTIFKHIVYFQLQIWGWTYSHCLL